MTISQLLEKKAHSAIETLYGQTVDASQIQLQPTKKEFEGDLTLVTFPLLRISKKKPEETGEELGNWLVENTPELSKYNVIKGFLNLTVSPSYWVNELVLAAATPAFGLTKADADSPLVMVEYSSPNTNKPLHLGHVRNNLLGFSLCRILEANGNKVVKTNIVNDRGVHICKSMLAWQKWGNGITPESSGIKGDKLVGEYYIRFDREYKAEIQALVSDGS
ncbi:MAG: arginine--tRNA ligase, partial [Bacteroidia bacterium]|nr:arginine--tRNA ligase [Bacteroidia bacterium]